MRRRSLRQCEDLEEVMPTERRLDMTEAGAR